MRIRGLVWLVIGAVVFALPYVGGPYFMVRWSDEVLGGRGVSWGLVAMGIGVAFLVYDVVTKKKKIP